MALSSSLKRFVNIMKTRGAVVISGLLLVLSALYCLASITFIFMGYTRSYLITIIFFGVFDFIASVITHLQIATLFIWITICLLLIYINRKYWWTTLKYVVLTTVLFSVGTFFGGLGLQITNLNSVVYGGRSYHLTYIYDWDDVTGYYNLLDCDVIGLSCNRLFVSQKSYPKIDVHAQIKVDETAQELSIIVEDNMIFRHRVE